MAESAPAGGGSTDALQLEVTRAPEGVTVRVAGEIDSACADELQAALVALGEEPPVPPEVVVDLERVPFLDSSGLRALMVASRTLQTAGSVLRVVSPAPAVRRVFEITGLASKFGLDTAG